MRALRKNHSLTDSTAPDQWLKNGVPLALQTDSVLVSQPVSQADSGSAYRCIVMNGVGADTSAAGVLIVLRDDCLSLIQ